MPAIFRLRVLLCGDTELRPETGPAHGWFLRLIHDFDARWSQELHPSHDAKSAPTPLREPRMPRDLRPFSLSPFYWNYFDSLDAEDFWPLGERSLLGLRDTLPEEMTEYAHHRQAHWQGEIPTYWLYSGQILALRLALFRESDIARFADIVSASPNLPRLGNAPCRLFRPPDPPAAEDLDFWYVSWEALANAPPADQLLLHFVTPTDFRAHQRDLTECGPADLLQGWIESFVRWAPADLPLSQRLKAGDFTFAGLRFLRDAPPLRAKTLLIKDKRVSKIGYEGSLLMEWASPAPLEERSAAHALVAWANFCGTGARTPLGMGQTRGGEPD